MERQARQTRLLNPLDRASEILFGLIMALSFTCSVSIINAHQTAIRQLLAAAISCNLAWGIVDAAMYLIGVLAERNRTRTLFDAVRRSGSATEARNYISNVLPPSIASLIDADTLAKIQTALDALPDDDAKVGLTTRDLKKAVGIFLLVFISTFPIVIPFVFISDTNLALRISNIIAIIMMFLCGWSVAIYVGASKWKLSIGMVLIGILLVIITIALGG